ncbi:hypothetical protein MKW98_032457 [Papaver atlanticum]|uniref:Cathepsin propeptide inhibitor domain-containing protein n=1 Tax=Papaver atlanticum TaxID=357466 RepID=A0AAD4SVH5_9MAGN|nr:hypothetical protein MKW98_032457 [Papaver atlanticum]
MATWTNFLRSSARNALKSQALAANRCLPVNRATSWPVTPLRQGLGSAARLFCSSIASGPELAKDWPEVTDDILNSEAKLHALFLTWLSYNDHHFDVEDEKAFTKRFEIFKDTARRVNQHYKSGFSFTCGLTCFADLTTKDRTTRSWKIYPKKLITIGIECEKLLETVGDYSSILGWIFEVILGHPLSNVFLNTKFTLGN